MNSLPNEIIQMVLAPAVQKKFFGEPKVLLQRYLGCYQQIFEMGAVLGHAFRKDFPWFVPFWSLPGREHDLAQSFHQIANEDVAAIGKVSSFFDLGMHREESNIYQTWRNAGKTQDQIEHRAQIHELSVQEAAEMLNFGLIRGVAFGGTFPGLVERLWKEGYESAVDPNKLHLLRQAGLTIHDGELKLISLAEQEKTLFSGVRSFATRNRPELVSQLEAILASTPIACSANM